jgi:uncharacterized protein YcnI
VTLIVPNESESASTVGLTVTLPEDVDLTSARTLPIPGWTATVQTAADGKRVSTISWKAVDGSKGLRPSEFGEFTFSAGPWPESADTVALQSDQNYSDGSVVAWNEIALDDATEPDHPAPVVTLGAPEHGHGDGHETAAPATAPAASAASASGDQETHGHEAQVTVQAAAPDNADPWFWRVTSIAALVVALGTVAALVVVLRRTRGSGS